METLFPYQLQKEDQLCFLHIGKTGGTTLVNVLQAVLEKSKICPKYHMEDIYKSSREELARYTFFRGHFTYDIHRLLPGNPILITMLRYPISRTRSLYQHVKLDKKNSLHEFIEPLSFSEFIQAQPKVRVEASNWQTRIITNQLQPSATPDLELAKKRLRENFYYVGLMERYVDSIILLNYTFKFGWLPLAFNKYKMLNLAQKTPIQQNNMTPAIVKKIKEINSLDIQLYEYALELFEERYALMNKSFT